MNFYKIKFDPNKSYTIKLCSLEKKYVYYRNNFKRVCIENQELKKQIEREIHGRDMLVNLNSNLKEEKEELLSELSKVQCDYRQLEEKIHEYEIGRLGE